VAIDSTSAWPCALVTIELARGSLGEPVRVTLDLCEWQRVAQRVAEAAEALGGCRHALRMAAS
jgi:hypothetical protein